MKMNKNTLYIKLKKPILYILTNLTSLKYWLVGLVLICFRVESVLLLKMNQFPNNLFP